MPSPDKSETQQQIRFGIIGPGRASARFAQGLTAVPDAVLHAVWGRNPERVRAFAESFAIPHGPASLREFLAPGTDASIDAVYVGTHPDSHAEFCIAALAAGKHVLCEKPAALNVRQLQAVLAAARRHNCLFMEAMKPPFFPLYKRLRQHLQEDPIGPVGFVRAGNGDTTLSPHHPVHFLELGGGGILGIGPYEAFLALDWLGELKRVHTLGRLTAAGVDSFALITTEHERGMAQLHATTDLLSHGDALLAGPLGYALIHASWWNPTRATIHYRDQRIVELHEPFAAGGFNYETAHFCELLRDGVRESPEITHALSLSMARLLEEARTALGVKFPNE